MKKRTLGILLALLLCVGLLTAGAAASSGGSSASSGAHTHFLCGGDTCTKVGHTEGEKVTFQPWTKTKSLPTDGKAYYLTGNVTIDRPWEPADGTIICLNGYNIVKNDPREDWTDGMTEGTISVPFDRTFALTDCQDAGKVTDAAAPGNIRHGVRVVGGTFNLYGGYISDTTTYNNSGIGVDVNWGTFNMYGGHITNNSVTDSVGTGGGVDVGSGGTFNLYGGVISGNTADRGGGVANANVFNMYGGEISGNEAKRSYHQGKEPNGGGVYQWEGTFTMTGGTITGNNVSDSQGKGNGGGVYMHAGSMSVSGTVKIAGNKVGDSNNDLWLDAKSNASDVALKIDGLKSGSSIGVTAELHSSDTTRTYPYLASGADSNTLKYFFSNMDGYALSVSGDYLKVEKKEYHYHPVCGAGCAHTDGSHSSENVEWTGVSSYDDLRALPSAPRRRRWAFAAPPPMSCCSRT